MDLACFGMTPVACKKSKIQLISFSLPATNLVFVANHLRVAGNSRSSHVKPSTCAVVLQVVQELRQRRLPAIEVGSLMKHAALR